MSAVHSFADRLDILYVDADEKAARMIGPTLERCRAVRHCRTLEEARAQFRAAIPNLCVLDPDLPDGDGLQLLGEMHAREPWLPIFVICAPRHAANTAQFIAAGASDLAVKPFDVGTLPKRVAWLLRAADRAMDEHRERLELENRLRHADRIASLGVLCATVAHEIAGPLQVVNLDAGILAERGGTPLTPTAVAELADEMLVAGNVIQSIVGRVRTFSRSTEELRVETTLGGVVDTALLLLRPRLVARKAKVRRPSGQGKRASLFPTRLTQALMNVIANACETRDAGAEVEVRFVERSGAIGIEVIDDGPGPAVEVTGRAGSLFYTTKPDGTGLGLHHIRRVMTEHGGRFEMSARSDGRTGASAVLLLPLDPATRLDA